MKNIYILSTIAILFMTSCDDWLDRDPKEKITEQQAYSSEGTINSVISGLYDRLPDIGSIAQDLGYYTQLDEGISGLYVNNFESFPADYWTYYNDLVNKKIVGPYVLIRDINTHLTNLDATNVLSPEKKTYYEAEARLLRVYVYFEMVKRMGGIPLITETAGFVPGSDPSIYQEPRNKEAEVYDFIASEIDEIKENLAANKVMTQYNRASKGLALAMKARAMLYAGTLAKYNSSMSTPVTLPGEEVGIPADKADGYFEAALDAVKELELMGIYGLYDKNSDKTSNFSEALIKKVSEGNNEVIFIKEFLAPSNMHSWTSNNICRTLRVGGVNGTGGSTVSPVLNLVDAFGKTDGTSGKLIPYVDPKHTDEIVDDNALDGNPDAYIYYDNLGDIFDKKDPRLFATVITPGQKFGGKDLSIQAGIAYFNAKTGKLSFQAGTFDNKDNSNVLMDDQRAPILDEKGQLIYKTKDDGPSKEAFSSSTGFYVAKYMDVSPKNTSTLASDIQFIRYRYAEVLLNGAEAAFELGQTDLAQKYIKQIRDRAGMLTGDNVTLEEIHNERRVELAFEGHRFYDIKRWRTAHEIFDGSTNTQTAMMYGLWPYKVYRPGHATHNKWIYVRRMHPGVYSSPRKFVLSNYYSAFPSKALENNPKLVKNPGQ